MRMGLPDTCIAASEATASHNVSQFLESTETPRDRMTLRSLQAALQIAADLTTLCRQHADERLTGIRRW